MSANELNRLVNSTWERDRKRGKSIEEMKNGALDLIGKKKPTPLPQWNSIGEALEKAKENKI